MDASTSKSPDYSLAAYTERDSIDPLTCEEGKLRREWAVLSTYKHTNDFAKFAEGHFRPRDWNDYVLIARYIRRGKIEDWAVMGFYATEHEALEDIEPGVTPVDLRLVTIHREREWAKRVEEAKQATESETARKLDADRHRRAQGSKAFRKLYESGQNGKPVDLALCARWNAFVSSPASEARKDEYAADPAFMERYHSALYADRVPTKRKAMREFFAYVEEHYPGALDGDSTLESPQTDADPTGKGA